jgi:hypothetical protein
MGRSVKFLSPSSFLVFPWYHRNSLPRWFSLGTLYVVVFYSHLILPLQRRDKFAGNKKNFFRLICSTPQLPKFTNTVGPGPGPAPPGRQRAIFQPMDTHRVVPVAHAVADRLLNKGLTEVFS